jgi:two-component system, response regulator RegA
MFETVLIVDDDSIFCDRLAKAFERRSFKVLQAVNFNAALESINSQKIDYAVLDLRLGKHSGLDLLKILIELYPALKAVVITGYGSIASAMEAIKIGAVNYLSKPVEISEILVALEINAEVATKKSSIKQVPSLEQVEWEHIQRVMTDCEGNVTRAAKMLGLHRRSLQRKLSRGL